MPADIVGTNVIDEDAAGGKRVRVPARARSSRTSCSPTRSTARRRRRRGAARGDAGALGHRREADLPARGAVLRARDAEPARDGGHLPAARGAARPLLLQARRRVSRPRRAAHDPRPHDRPTTTPQPQAGARQGAHPRDARARARGAGRAPRAGLRGARRARDAPGEPGGARRCRSSSCATARRRAARRRCSSPRRSARCSRAASRSSIDDIRARRAAGAAPPPDPQLRGRGRGRQDRHDHRRDPRRRPKEA